MVHLDGRRPKPAPAPAPAKKDRSKLDAAEEALVAYRKEAKKRLAEIDRRRRMLEGEIEALEAEIDRQTRALEARALRERKFYEGGRAVAKKKRASMLERPDLRRVSLLENIPSEAWARHPLNFPAFRAGFDWEISRPVTIIVGANCSGKSTLLEAIAAHCGFALTGGTRNVAHRTSEEEELSSFLRFSWLPKATQGFFFRAEAFFAFVDGLLPDGARTLRRWLLTRLMARCHCESAAMASRSWRCSKIDLGRVASDPMHEPEAALSPQWQIQFLKLSRKLHRRGESQGDSSPPTRR